MCQCTKLFQKVVPTIIAERNGNCLFIIIEVDKITMEHSNANLLNSHLELLHRPIFSMKWYAKFILN